MEVLSFTDEKANDNFSLYKNVADELLTALSTPDIRIEPV